MIDREKVLKGLEYCIKDIECTGCPYEQKCFNADDDRQFGEDMMRDALALLKEPEPHLMTVDELEALPVGSVVWEEYYCNAEEGKGTEINPAMKINSCTIMTGEEYTIIMDGMGDPDVDGNRLRCWSARPTDEQRAAVEWDGIRYSESKEDHHES